MKKRIVFAVVAVAAGGAMGVLIPAASAGAQTAQLPPACFVVDGPGGAIVQVGYAPNGPSDCHQLG